MIYIYIYIYIYIIQELIIFCGGIAGNLARVASKKFVLGSNSWIRGERELCATKLA